MSIARACALTGRSRATHYRHTDPHGVSLGPLHGPHPPRRPPPSTITDDERAAATQVCHGPPPSVLRSGPTYPAPSPWCSDGGQRSPT
jgi:hypothetical protein